VCRKALDTAMLACEAVEQTEARQVKGVPVDLLTAASSGAKRVLIEFNGRGSDAAFTVDDVRALREFYAAVAKRRP
jgi:hypothetical protein